MNIKLLLFTHYNILIKISSNLNNSSLLSQITYYNKQISILSIPYLSNNIFDEQAYILFL